MHSGQGRRQEATEGKGKETKDQHNSMNNNYLREFKQQILLFMKLSRLKFMFCDTMHMSNILPRL